MDGKIHTAFILELLGKPEEHVKSSLTALTDKLGGEKGVKIINKTEYEPKKVEDSKDLFTAFAEIEAEFESLNHYFGVLFAYMPSNIELIKPEKITLSNSDFSDIGSRIMHRLHEYDAIAKNMLFEKEILLKELKKADPEAHKKLTTAPEESKQPENKDKT